MFEKFYSPNQISFTIPSYVQVAVGYSHIVVVTSELKVYSWGENSRGQLGLDDYQPRNVPVLIESLNGRNIKR